MCFETPMLRQLVLMSAAFHALNLAALLFLARLWRHRYAEEPAIRPRVSQIAADFGILGTLAIASAASFGLVARADGFGILNLVSQWVFAELFVLLTMATYWLRRAEVGVAAVWQSQSARSRSSRSRTDSSR